MPLAHKKYYTLGIASENKSLWALHKDFGAYAVPWADVPDKATVLNVGCGAAALQGAVNIDVSQLPGVDVVHDLNVFPWPFDDEQFNHVIAHHVVEHMNDVVGFMSEVYRVLTPGGVLEVLTPHYSDGGSWVDPTHHWHLHTSSFLYFEEGHPFCYYSRCRFKCLVDVELARIWRLLGFQFLVNLVSRFPSALWIRRLWENHLSFVVRGKTIRALCMKPTGG